MDRTFERSTVQPKATGLEPFHQKKQADGSRGLKNPHIVTQFNSAESYAVENPYWPETW